jgi:catecholate siderophore receptor
MPRFKRRPLAAAVLMMFSSTHYALAQSQSEATLPEVRVRGQQDTGFRVESTGAATRTDTPLRDIPQIINTVPQDVIRSQGAKSLQDALRNVPGISYAAPEGGTQANHVYYLRGFPAGGDIFLDGIRDLGEYNRDLFATESVEVLKGPSSLMFGRGSTGGVIHQTSKVADLLPRKELGVTVGSFDLKRLEGDLNVRTGDASAFRLVAMGEDSGSYRYPQDVKKAGIAPSWRWGIGGRTEVSLGLFYLKTEDVTDYGQPTLTPAFTGTTQFAMPPISPRSYYGFANHDATDHETQMATLRVVHEIRRDLRLRNTLRWASYERQVEASIATLNATDLVGNPVTPGTPLSLLAVNRRHDGGRTRDNDDSVLINQTELTWRLDAGGLRHTVLGGLELAREELHRWNYVLDADPLTAGTQAPASITPLLNPDPYTQLSYTKTPNVRANAQGDTVALYAQDQIEINEQWKALVGLRWERYEAQARTSNFLTGAIASGPFERSDTLVSGRAGLIWQPTPQQSHYVSFGNSYNPSGELGVYGGTGTNLNVNNERLEPEENRGYELGTHWNLGALQLRGALFRNEKINARMNDPVSGTTVLAGERRVDGVEFQVSGHLARNWEITSGVAFMDGRIVTGPANVQGKTPLGVADVAGNVWTVYRLGGGWEIGGGVRGTSSYWLNDANTGKVPAYHVLDATLAYVQKRYEVRLNLYNLADETYYYGGYQNNPNRVLPGAPFSGAVTVRYNFD